MLIFYLEVFVKDINNHAFFLVLGFLSSMTGIKDILNFWNFTHANFTPKIKRRPRIPANLRKQDPRNIALPSFVVKTRDLPFTFHTNHPSSLDQKLVSCNNGLSFLVFFFLAPKSLSVSFKFSVHVKP